MKQINNHGDLNSKQTMNKFLDVLIGDDSE